MRQRARTRQVARLAAALCAAAAFAAPCAQALTLGISDQQPATFTDKTFYDTGIAPARYIVPWDGLDVDSGRIVAWMKAAWTAHADVMVAFSRSWGSRCPSSPCVLPTVDQYTKAVQKFLTWYPWVKTITPWNEVNDQGQPTNPNPTRAAAYYQAAVKVCPSCTVLGADVIDNGTQTSWLATFLRALPAAPKLWGLHNYVDGNYFRSTGTQSVLNAVPGEIWLTETGGLVKYIGPSGTTGFAYDENRAADAESFLLSIADAHPDRITRYYHYLWKSGGTSDRFDSGLLRADGTTRPAFDVLRPLFPGRPAPAVPGTNRVATAAAGADPATTTATPRKARAVVVTRGRSRRPLKLRVACLAPKGKRCRGSLKVPRLGTVRFSLRAGKSRTITMRRRTAPSKPKVTVTLTAPARDRWTAVAAVAVPRR